MNTCSVCSLSESEKGEAEIRLRTKRSHPAIAAELMDLGIKLKAGDLSKHYNNHMDKEKMRDIEHPNLLGVMDLNRKLEELTQESLERDYTQEVMNGYKEIHILLEQATKLNAVMVVEQLSNCATRQRPFPSEEIRGLTHLMGMLKNLPMHSDEPLSGRFFEISEKVKEKNRIN